MIDIYKDRYIYTIKKIDCKIDKHVVNQINNRASWSDRRIKKLIDLYLDNQIYK